MAVGRPHCFQASTRGPNGRGLTAAVGEDAAVVVVRGLQVEPYEYRRAVFCDGALGDNQTLGDGSVAAAFGHEGEDLSFAGAEDGKLV